MSLEEFRARFAEEKPYFEFWYGEAVQKSVPTVLHVLLCAILSDQLRRLGYRAGPELELRVDVNWQPKADVAAWSGEIDADYPMTPVDVVIEVLSPDDRMQRVYAKCREYARLGIPAIFVMDPATYDAWRWDRQTTNLERTSTLETTKGSIAVEEIWKELERELTK